MELLKSIESILENETNEISILSTVACEVFQYVPDLNWVGFYRNVNGTLKVGPYQGTLGCLTITFDRGVCGKCATEKAIQIVNNVEAMECHIACSTETKSELCLPVMNENNDILSVFDIDSPVLNRFDEGTIELLTKINHLVSTKLAKMTL